MEKNKIEKELTQKFNLLCQFFNFDPSLFNLEIKTEELRGIYINVSAKNPEDLKILIGAKGSIARKFRECFKLLGQLTKRRIVYFIPPQR